MKEWQAAFHGYPKTKDWTLQESFSLGAAGVSARARTRFFIGRAPGSVTIAIAISIGSVRGGEGDNGDRAAQHGEGEHQTKSELLHRSASFKVPSI